MCLTDKNTDRCRFLTLELALSHLSYLFNDSKSQSHKNMIHFIKFRMKTCYGSGWILVRGCNCRLNLIAPLGQCGLGSRWDFQPSCTNVYQHPGILKKRHKKRKSPHAFHHGTFFPAALLTHML